jgi:predicted enzyme related to lactoylglutathione lyase
MPYRRLLAFLLVAIGATVSASAAPPPPPPVRPLIIQESMNVFRRFDPKLRERMVAFYEKVLALKPLQPIQLSATQQMILFGIGTGQVKLSAELDPRRAYHLGGVHAGRGIRLFTFFFPDEAGLAARFTAQGYAAPEFRDRGDGNRAALVEDPGGFPLQLVVIPNAPSETYEKVEVGINAADLERSRAFYRSFVGLDELAPVQDASLGVTKFPFRHGQTTVNVWSRGQDLPADTGSAGMQYVISDVETVDARAKALNVTVEQPLSTIPGFTVRTVWLNDPDGVTNYFAQVGAAPAAGK